MTKAQALKKLAQTREITTGMLKPLGIPFDLWLRYAQLDKERTEQFIDGAIKFYSAK